MKKTIFLLLLLIISCNQKEQNIIEKPNAATTDNPVPLKRASQAIAVKHYSNERFRDVTVEKLAGKKYRVKGKAQIFEASFSWILEDGHNELQKGHVMTDAGAPEWGNFDFTIDAVKKEENSTLTLILFEVSAKDGSRQYELPIALL